MMVPAIASTACQQRVSLGQSLGGGYVSGVSPKFFLDYRLYIFFPDNKYYFYGGCITGKKFFYFLFFILRGQYNLEINFRFRNTVKNTFYPRPSICFKNFYIIFLFRSDDLLNRPRANQKENRGIILPLFLLQLFLLHT